MRLPVLTASLLCGCALSLAAQTTQTEFGKNRVQFHQDFAEWSQYESRNFITYWYGEGRYIGQSVVQLAENDFQDIQGILEHRMNDKIEIIVYTDLTDLKQSNIGSEEAFENTGGQTKIVGNKMFVYFNGDHNDLRRQVREGVASVFLNAMLFGSNLQEIVQNALMMNLPQWFKDGLISYVGQAWTPALDDRLRDLFLTGEFEDFDDLARRHPALAGHSLWFFISQLYGSATVSNLLYLTRINRSVESGFLYVLGSSYASTTLNWFDFFQQRYTAEANVMMPPPMAAVPIRNRRNIPLYQLRLSPDGQQIAYVLNEIGKVKVYVQDLRTGKRTCVFREGSRNPIQATDYNYPLLAWNPNQQELAILHEKRDVPKLLRYQILTKEKISEELTGNFQRVYSMDYLTPRDLVLSAAVRGQSDLFRYALQNRQSQRLTNDVWDDLDAVPTSIRGRRGILFASNRPDSLNRSVPLDSVLPVGRFDIFYLDLDSIGFRHNGELIRITRTPEADERQPLPIDSLWFGFLSDASGIRNRRIGFLKDYIHHVDQVVRLTDGSTRRIRSGQSLADHLDSTELSLLDSVWLDSVIKEKAILHTASNYDRSILEHSKSRRPAFTELLFRDGTWQVYHGNIDPLVLYLPPATLLRQQQLAMDRTPQPDQPTQQPVPVMPTPPSPPRQDTGKIDIDNYLFQSEFDDDEVVVRRPDADSVAPAPAPVPEPVQPQLLYRQPDAESVFSTRSQPAPFRSSRIIPYRLKFRTDFVTTQMDNALLFDGLSSFAGVPQDFGYPPPGILLKANFKDLLEDYEFEGGVRVPTSFNGAEYFLLFNDRKKRLDKRYAAYYRRLRFTEDNSPPPTKFDNAIFLLQYQLRYPLDVFTSLRAVNTLRFDRSTWLASNPAALETPDIRSQRLGTRLEYVFDNTLDVSLNIKNGTRYKIFAELVKRFEVDLTGDVQVRAGEGFMTVFGADARHYQRVLRHSVLATRLAGATSLGQERVLYMLGGTDNWLLPQFDMTIPFPAGNDYAFRSVATNVRGFQLNARNGNSYALFNSEFRSPVLRYLFPFSASNFIRNFQWVAFFDAGTAWEGLNPFNESSPLNTWRDQNTNVQIEVSYFRDPVVFGYGTGIRTLLFGYFVRLDYAWGIETREVQSPRLYFSMGMDF
ncbi:MAG: hypothetical protein RLY31_125 [Bacteroidota bacterium]